MPDSVETMKYPVDMKNTLDRLNVKICSKVKIVSDKCK